MGGVGGEPVLFRGVVSQHGATKVSLSRKSGAPCRPLSYPRRYFTKNSNVRRLTSSTLGSMSFPDRPCPAPLAMTHSTGTPRARAASSIFCEWAQDKGRTLHYDLPDELRERAIELGVATAITWRELVSKRSRSSP